VIRSYLATPILDAVIATGLYSSHLATLHDTPPTDETLEAENFRTQLINHITYAWVFDVPGADDLLRTLQTNAADANNEAFVHNLAFGLLREGDDELVQAAIPRLLELWRGRINELTGDSSELASYSWWYSAGRLPEPEATRLLTDTINKTSGALGDLRGCLDQAAVIAGPPRRRRLLACRAAGDRARPRRAQAHRRPHPQLAHGDHRCRRRRGWSPRHAAHPRTG
jgi:hypothetical protein